MYVLSGNGDVIQPDDEIIGIGSGGSYALAAARALKEHTDLPRPRSSGAASRSPATSASTRTGTSPFSNWTERAIGDRCDEHRGADDARAGGTAPRKEGPGWTS
jgi:hypothetical protein